MSSFFYLASFGRIRSTTRGEELNFGAWMAEKRKTAGLTLRELSKRSKLSLPYVAALERGTSEAPPLQTCKELARALGVGWEDMWQYSFSSRLRKWLKREGYSEISEAELLDLVRRIESVRK